MSGDILETIDNALADWTSPDAMRWRPDGGEKPGSSFTFESQAVSVTGLDSWQPPSATCFTVGPGADARIGTMFVTRVAGGYEARIYRLPSGLAPGVHYNIPVTDLEVVSAGFYDERGTLVREL